MTNDSFVGDGGEEAPVQTHQEAHLAHDGWSRNQIKEETRQNLDKEQKEARERLGMVRRQLSILADSRDSYNVGTDQIVSVFLVH